MELEYSFGRWSSKKESDVSGSLFATIRQPDEDQSAGYHLHMWADIGTPNMARNISVFVRPADFTKIAKLMIQADRDATLQAFAEAILAHPGE